MKRFSLLILLFAFTTVCACADLNGELITASGNGNIEEVKNLISRGADVTAKDDIFGRTPLHWASVGGHLEIVKYLVEKGAVINAKDNNGITPLHFGCGGGNLEVVKHLIANGADIDAKSDGGWAPLHTAANNAGLEIVKYLVETGVDVGATDIKNMTALDYAEEKRYPDVKEFLEKVQSGE
jgi:ankyrin repeat protein